MRVPEDMPQPGRRRRAGRAPKERSGRGRVLLVVAAVAIFILITSLRGIASFFTDYLWFDSLGQGSVFRTILGAKAALAIIFTGLFFVLMWVNLWIGDRIAPRFRPAGPEEELVERYHELVGGRTGLVRVVVSLLFALIAGAGVSSQWNDWLLFVNRVDFGIDDPQFGRDIGFYVFQLPFLTFVVDWLFAAFVIILIVTSVAHYLNGGIRVNTPFQRVTPQVKAHLSVLLAVLALIKAGGYYLQQFELTTSERGTVDGALFTDVKAQLPAIRLLLLISLFALVLFLVNIRRRGWVLPVLAVGLWAFVAVVAGGIVPAVIQKFRVEPSESSREEPYLERNIEATREAFGLAGVIAEDFAAEDGLGELTESELQANADIINNIRLWDPSERILGQTYRQLQEVKGFYEIRDVDVDRYELNGELTQVMIASRELDTSGVPQQSWEARHLAFTHGYGVVLAPANTKNEEDEPNLLIENVPLRNTTGIDVPEPGLYIGEDQGGYVIVDTQRREIDFQEGDEDVFTDYAGEDGVGIGSWIRRAAFALRFGDFNPLFSGAITADSRILYLRDVNDRVRALAPFLHFDSDPYPVLVDSKVQWVVDAYTTTSRYPYGQDAEQTELPNESGLDDHGFNYVRNSVKAVVDAYDGTVTLYVVDDDDPIAAAYRKAFPSLFSSDDPPEELAQHFRYPEDLFRVQTNMYGRYHQTEADRFYNNSDGWVVSEDAGTARVTTTTLAGGGGAVASAGSQNRADPVYQLTRLPDQENEAFVLLSTFSPIPAEAGDARQQLTAFLTASSDPADYGTLRAFVMPRSDLPPGPFLAAANISSDTDVGQFETEQGIEGGGSEVLRGNVVLVPLGDTIMYVRPMYVQSDTGQLPLLRAVAVEFDGNVGFGPTLRQAIEDLPDFGVGLTFIEPDVVPERPVGPRPETEEPEAPQVTVASLLAEAETLFAEADAALQESPPDFATYAVRISEARVKVAAAQALVDLDASSGSPPAETTTTAPASG